MNDKSDQDLDELLSRHFEACLDGQLGRAAAAFRDEMATRNRWRAWTAAGAALAACLAVAWAFYGHRSPKPEVVVAPITAPTVDEAAVTPVVQSATWSRMVDDGAAVVDGQPVRQLRRKLVEEIEWYDAADGAVVRQTVPQQQIFLIGMQTD
jgi:hypothetical protein